MSRISSIADGILRLPLLWGGMACLAFYAMISTGSIDHPLVDRYFNSHIVEQITTTMFFVGIAALVLRLCSLLTQFGVVGRSLIEPIPAGGQPVSDCGMLLENLAKLPQFLSETYLVRRLRDALDWIRRREAVDGLDEELLRLEERDWDRMASGYSLVRIIAWAMPMLGFLGTVIGITLAIANLNMEALLEGTDDVTSGLGVAFDTTALALALTIVLMLAKYGVEHVEQHLLTGVAIRCRSELVGRFQHVGGANDPQVASIHRMCDQVIRAVETLSARQADVWKGTIDQTHHHWQSSLAQAGEEFGEALKNGLEEGLRDHATGLTHGVEQQLASLNENVGLQVGHLNSATIDVAQQLTDTLTKQIETLAASGQAFSERLDSRGESMVSNLRDGLQQMAELLVEALHKHGDSLTQAESELASENRRHLVEVEAALGEAMVLAADRQEKLIQRSEEALQQMQAVAAGSVDATIAQQQELVRHGEVLMKVVDATGQVKELEDSLVQNLATLGRSDSLEQTLGNLTAAIELLNDRGGSSPPNPKSHAA